MNYAAALAYVHSLQKFGINPGLERISALLRHLGNPHLFFPCIHIGGTNGKGSVTATVSSILRAAGLKVGRYISPSLQAFNERINVDGSDIPDEALADLITAVKPAVDAVASEPGVGHPTEFEVVTAAAFEYFRAAKVDMAVLEVGLGGRLDSTNIIPVPLVACITNVAYDHMDILGATIERIAAEKAGIIKDGGVVVTGASEPAALQVIRDVCRQKGALLWQVGCDIRYAARPPSGGCQHFAVETPERKYDDLTTPLLGAHQVRNAAIAVGIIDALGRRGSSIAPEAVVRGMADVFWPGRLEVVQRNPTVVLDGAHNPDGAHALRQALLEMFRYDRLILVLGILRDKAYDEMLALLTPLAATVILTKSGSPRAASVEELRAAAVKYHADVRTQENIGRAIEEALQLARPSDLVCIAGSLYTVGEARAKWAKTAANRIKLLT